MMSMLFSPPKMPPVQAAPPPTPPKQDSTLNAQMAQAGRQMGLLATLFGFRSPAGTSTSQHTMTGQG